MNTIFTQNRALPLALALVCIVPAYMAYQNYAKTQNEKQQADSLEKAHGIYLQGMEQYKKTNYDQAITVFKSAIETYPQHGPAHNGLCLALMRLNNFESAFTHAQQAVEANPEFAPSYLILGQLELQRNNREQAKKAFETAVKLDVKLAEGHISLTKILFAEKTTESINHAHRHALLALELSPNNKDALMNMANIQFVSGNSEQAKVYYTKVLEVAPDYADARAVLAQIDKQTVTA